MKKEERETNEGKQLPYKDINKHTGRKKNNMYLEILEAHTKKQRFMEDTYSRSKLQK